MRALSQFLNISNNYLLEILLILLYGKFYVFLNISNNTGNSLYNSSVLLYGNFYVLVRTNKTAVQLTVQHLGIIYYIINYFPNSAFFTQIYLISKDLVVAKLIYKICPCHSIAEILLKLVLNTNQSTKFRSTFGI